MTNKVSEPRGWVGYDGECAFCRKQVERWRAIFEERGFVFLPLQSDFWRSRAGLGVPLEMEEMKLLLHNGRLLGGAEALACLGGTVWWLAPLAWLARRPILRCLASSAYRWVARHRRSIS